ncbi:MAG: non-hydrolyzing UDP-N-acetylglucosamine 2-epimerase [Sediminibacterium sp.]
MKKVILVFGTRPEAIKMAPLVKEFQKYTDKFKTICCVTGQHRQMLDQVLDIFEIVPDYDLDIMQEGQDLFDVTSRVLYGMRDILAKEKPDMVFVHGDTTTSMATALAAFYKQIPVAHIEAGLRTYNKYSPWPEEINRQITGRITSLHFTPTESSKTNLLNEGVADNQILVTGNTVIDSLFSVLNIVRNNRALQDKISNSLIAKGYNINGLTISKKLILITGHRRENFGEGFINICNAIKTLTLKYPDVDFIYPMHLNPNVRQPIEQIFGKNDINNIYFIEPLDYLSFIYLMDKSYIILTDSGGIQEEAPSLGKPVLVMRDTTERPEAIDAGTVELVGTNESKIINSVSKLLDDEIYYEKISKANNPYGDGLACARIVDFLNR